MVIKLNVQAAVLCISFLISCSIVVDFGLFHVHSHLILQHSPWFHWHSHTLQRLPASLLPPLLTFGRFCVGMLVSWPTFLQGKAVYFKIIQTHVFLFWRTNNVQDTATNSGVQIFPTNTHGTKITGSGLSLSAYAISQNPGIAPNNNAPKEYANIPA